MEHLKRQIKDSYEGRGLMPAGSWKEESDHIFGPEAARNVYQNLMQAGIIPAAERNFTFVSPTANLPTHEWRLFQEDQKNRSGRGLFLVGDISDAGINFPNVQQASVRSDFQYFRWDAEHLPIRDGSVDLLWDRKGWLWHAAQTGDSVRFLNTIHQYHALLRDGGSIVIDNIKGYEAMMSRMTFSETMRSIILYLAAFAKIRRVRPSEMIVGENIKQYEPSTVDMIGRLRKIDGHDIWDKLGEKFDRLVVGSGIERVLVLKKKKKEERSVQIG